MFNIILSTIENDINVNMLHMVGTNFTMGIAIKCTPGNILCIEISFVSECITLNGVVLTNAFFSKNRPKSATSFEPARMFVINF